jgi:hypothetical protein
MNSRSMMKCSDCGIIYFEGDVHLCSGSVSFTSVSGVPNRSCNGVGPAAVLYYGITAKNAVQRGDWAACLLESGYSVRFAPGLRLEYWRD